MAIAIETVTTLSQENQDLTAMALTTAMDDVVVADIAPVAIMVTRLMVTIVTDPVQEPTSVLEEADVWKMRPHTEDIHGALASSILAIIIALMVAAVAVIIEIVETQEEDHHQIAIMLMALQKNYHAVMHVVETQKEDHRQIAIMLTAFQQIIMPICMLSIHQHQMRALPQDLMLEVVYHLTVTVGDN